MAVEWLPWVAAGWGILSLLLGGAAAVVIWLNLQAWKKGPPV